MAKVLPPFPSFSVHEDNASVGSRWKKWLKHFEMYLAAHDVKDSTPKRALLLYSGGEGVSDIFETLPDQEEEEDYAKAVTALNGYFQPKVNETYEIYIFRNATQKFKSHIVVSCLSSRLRRRALREDMNLWPWSRDVWKAKGIEEQDKLAQVAEVQTEKEDCFQ